MDSPPTANKNLTTDTPNIETPITVASSQPFAYPYPPYLYRHPYGAPSFAL